MIGARIKNLRKSRSDSKNLLNIIVTELKNIQPLPSKSQQVCSVGMFGSVVGVDLRYVKRGMDG